LDRPKNDKRKTKETLKRLKKYKIIAGVDEVGRGCLAGPVVSAAVILKKDVQIKNLKDSKKLTFEQRIETSKDIKNNSLFSIGVASVKEIEKLNILQASLLSMKRAILNLPKKPDLVLVDGIFTPKILIKCKTVIKGDEKINCISAASILAKVYRDKVMIRMSKKFKNYSWNKNFGYGTKQHMLGLRKYGLTTMHRKNFYPIHKMLLK
jgi:ribonuclease HII